MKKAVAAIAFLVLVLAGFVFVLPRALGSDTLRTVLARQLSEASGADISFNGPIRFSVVPDFGIVAENLGYVSGDGSVSITSERSVASVNLMSLLSDQIRITGIDLQNPRILLADAAMDEAGAAPEPGEEDDVFKLAAAYLERLSIDRVVVTGGEIAEKRKGVVQPVASGIDLRLSVPGITEPASFTFSGKVNGRKMDVAADIGSLRNLLDRRPAEFSLSAKTEQPPHPALADVRASGSIQLAGDGSYRITGGEIDSAGQKMRLDVSYVPGDRPFVMARIEAGVLDFADLQLGEAAGTEGASDREGEPSDGPDLSALRNFDADIELRFHTLRAGEAVARDLAMQAELRDGRLNSTLSSKQVAGGALEAGMHMALDSETPEASGSLNLTSIDIERLMALLGRHAPVSGRLSSQLQYAFLGLDANTIRDSINVGGVVSVRDGSVDVPQLAEIAGPGAGRVDALDAKAEIADISKPLAVSGSAHWNGEAVDFASSIVLTDLLSGQPGMVSVDLRSQPVNAKFSGTIALSGSVKGRTDITAASLSRALRWFGQDTGTPLGRFSYSGETTVDGDKLTLNDAAIVLDDIHANGSVSVGMAEKTTIVAALSVDTLDFGRLTGGADATGEASAATSQPAAIDLSMLRQLDADIRLDASQIGYGEVKAGPATATLTVKDGVARLVVPQAGFYDGTVTADVTANGAGETPAIEFAARLAEVSALPLLNDAAGFQRIEGKLTAEVAVKGSGHNSDALARTLDGKAGVVFSDGALRGIDVAKLINNLRSLIRSGYEEEAGDKTEFTELSVSLDIEDGVGRTEDLRLLGPFVRMSGEGSVDFAAQTIDMRLNPRVVGSLDGQDGNFDVSGLGMPIIVNGALSRPRIYPDISGILANPQQALQTLSRMGDNISELTTGGAGSIDSLKDKLGVDSGSTADGVVSGLIDRLGGGEAGNEVDDAPGGTRDLIGSLVRGVTGRQTRQPDTQAAPPPDQQVLQPAETQPGSDTAPAAGAVEGEADVVLPTENVPVPTPNPRRVAAAVPASTQNTDPPTPDTSKTLTDQAVEAIGSQIAPESDKEGTADLIKGLIERIER